MNIESHDPNIGDYEIGVLISEGGFGKVLHGIHKPTRKDVALKIVDLYSCQRHPFVAETIKRK